MTAHPPPVPPDQQPRHGTGNEKANTEAKEAHPSRDINTAEQGQPGNTKQNTTNVGLQQDR